MTENLDTALMEISRRIASFEDEPSQPGRPAGSATGGSRFEHEVAACIAAFIESTLRHYPFLECLWVAFEPTLPFPNRGTNSTPIKNVRALGNPDLDRYIVFHFPHLKPEVNCRGIKYVREDWLRRSFLVAEWSDHYLEDIRLRGWIPEEDLPFGGSRYRQIYENLATNFDGAIAFIEKGRLVNKSLVEAKSAKSSDGAKLDGNAHERFSYQNLEYVEIGALYPSTELLLFTNQAFLKYRNKYHTGFSVHALRLSRAFGWYKFNIISSAEQYYRLVRGWADWLKGGNP